MQDRRVPKLRKTSILENVFVLILLGLLAGAVGGMGIGMIQLHSMANASSAASGK